MIDLKLNKGRTTSASTDQRVHPKNNFTNENQGLNRLVFDLDYFRASVRQNAQQSSNKYVKEINRKWNNADTTKIVDNITTLKQGGLKPSKLKFNVDGNEYKSLATKQFSPSSKDSLFFGKSTY